MNPGKLRHRVSFDELVTDLDSDGATTTDWVPVFGDALWAQVKHLSGGEIIAASAVQSKVTARIIVRFRPGFKASQRATHRGTIYNIEAVIPDPETGREWITLLCSSGVSEGQ